MTAMEFEVRNAVIKAARIDMGDRGLLTAWLDLDYGGAGQGFGGYALYLPKSFSHHEVQGPAGHFIFRVLEIAGVESWDGLTGKTVRVRSNHTKIDAIGHIIKDDWFFPEKDFAAAKKRAKGAIGDIADERQRQIDKEGWSLEHDDAHQAGEMAEAAACYATGYRIIAKNRSQQVADPLRRIIGEGSLWPWATSWWKPDGRRRELVKAGALIVAEIERLDRRADGVRS